MDKAKLVAKLNQAIALELCGLLQYNQYSHVLMGPDRKVWRDFFKEASDEALGHARKFAQRVVALGGVPSVEPDAVKQASDAMEMLRNSLDVERRAVEIYTEALAMCEDNPAYRNILEEQIQMETEDVEELEKYLDQVQKVGMATSGKRATKTA
jgi:bacterioferritin